MGKIDPLATWQSVKTLVRQAQEYADAGYTRIKDTSGISKLNKFLNVPNATAQPEPEHKNLTTNSVPKDILDAISSEFKKILEFIELYLLQDNGSAFYGLILVEMEMGIDFSQRGIIDLKTKSKPIRVTYNPFFGLDYSLNELLGETINEMMKIVYMHPVTYAKLNHEKDTRKHEDLEIGSSVSSTDTVNRDVKYDGAKNRVRLHENTYTRSDLENDLENNRMLNANESLEYYYSVAQAYRKKQPSAPNNNMQSNSNSNSGGSNSVATPGNDSGNAVHDWENTTNPNDLQEELKDVIKEAYDNLNDKQRGTVPSNIIQQIEMLFKKPELSWKDILRKYVGIIPAGHRPSRLRLNRRQPDRFDLSGQLSNKVVRLVIAIDTSGSMSDHEIAYCMNEVYNIVKDYSTEITVIECDAEIGKIYTVRSPKDIQTKVTGRGGTSYVPVIDYVNSHKFKDAVLIYFTDGGGDYEIERPRTYRNLWVVTGNGSNLSLKEPYGEVKTLKMDAEYQRRFR